MKIQQKKQQPSIGFYFRQIFVGYKETVDVKTISSYWLSNWRKFHIEICFALHRNDWQIDDLDIMVFRSLWHSRPTSVFLSSLQLFLNECAPIARLRPSNYPNNFFNPSIRSTKNFHEWFSASAVSWSFLAKRL